MAKSGKSGVKIPKQVAGVKVPKKLRKTGKKLIAKAGSPEGQRAIAAGMAMLGTAIAAKAQAKAARTAERADEGASTSKPTIPARPLKPGDAGIDPARNPAADFGAQLGPEIERAIATGLGALETFLGGLKRPR